MNLSSTAAKRIILSNPVELGGHSAVTEVPPAFEGRCAVIEKYTDKTIAVLPNAQEAELVAGYACTRDGGFGSTVVVANKKEKATHGSFEEWLIS